MATSENSDRIPFGDGPAQSIPADWAEPLLRILYMENRDRFGAAVGQLVSGTAYNARRRRGGAEDQAEAGQ